MLARLRDLTLEFARGEATLETLRGAARAERVDRPLADAILRLIAEWEQGGMTDNALSRNELRARAKQLVPPAPPDPPSSSRRDPSESIYAAGLRGQRRRG